MSCIDEAEASLELPMSCIVVGWDYSVEVVDYIDAVKDYIVTEVEHCLWGLKDISYLMIINY